MGEHENLQPDIPQVLTGAMGEQLEAHRTSGLVSTLIHAQQTSPFYRELLHDRRITSDNAIDILRKLPPMASKLWLNNREQIRTSSTKGATVGFTGGTTGKRTPFLSVKAERDAAKRLFLDNAEYSMPTLNLMNMKHGVPSLEDFGPNTVTIPFSLPYVDLEEVVNILERRMPPYTAMPSFEVLYGSVHMVKVITMFLWRTRNKLDDLGIKYIRVYSQMLSPRWRERIEGLWGAHVEQIYGASELRMCNSRNCKHCGYYHLPPTCIGEVLDPEDSSPITTGSQCGTLAVTSFYPFVQLEPRIRYCPGDLVELSAKPCQVWGEAGFRVLGRLQYSVQFGKGQWLTPGRVFNVVADLLDVATFHEVAATLGDVSYHECGSPQFLLEDGDRTITLHVELRYDPVIWPVEAQALSWKIHDGLGVPGLNIVLWAPGRLPGERIF